MERCTQGPLATLLAAIAVAGIVGCASSRPPEHRHAAPEGWPVDRGKAVITSGFGAPRGGSRHQGIDLAVPAGTAVRATADGVVSFAGRARGWGRCVVIDHVDGWQTRYAHLKRIKVDRGGRVRRGDLLGKAGRSGNASGSHLHYEVLRDGHPVDPRPTLE
jgi:murein DD-endopeptidase MepM/ murein hydrolase activator NlpD